LGYYVSMKHCINCRQPLSALNTYRTYLKYRDYRCTICKKKKLNNNYRQQLGTAKWIRYIIRAMANSRRQCLSEQRVSQLAEQLHVLLTKTSYCRYTGRKLVPGKNTHLDHKIPASRAPNRLFDIKNLQWVDSRYNQAKHRMTDRQFLNFCRLIVSRAGKTK
jgi:hypothetical protein